VVFDFTENVEQFEDDEVPNSLFNPLNDRDENDIEENRTLF
jgi:hypothetical protein